VIVFSILSILGFSVLSHYFLSVEILLKFGFALTGFGLILGVPTGFYYHLLLFKFLKKRVALPFFWWLSPLKYHVYLIEYELKGLKIWFQIGALGFFISLGGCFIVFIGLIK